jgi:hypothetical protein
VLRRVPLYPFLFALYPVLSLAAHNIHEIALSDILRPLVISLLLAGVILGLARLLLRDWDRAALASTIILLLVFSYGQIYAEIRNIQLGGLILFRHRTLGVLWLGLMAIGVIWAWRWLKKPAAWTGWLNLLSALLLIYPIFVIVGNEASRAISLTRGKESAGSAGTGSTGAPDVYYIILDGYGRQDLLKKKFGYDNSNFIDGLKQRGFYVADCAQSNYAFTELSLASSLNYNYLNDLASGFPTEDALDLLIQHGAVRSFFEAHGYQIYAFPTGFPWTEWKDADVYFGDVTSANAWNDFETLFAQTTLLRIPLDLTQLRFTFNSENNRRARILAELKNLKTIPGKKGSKFVFAHIVAPHQPYVFGPNGEPVNQDPDTASIQEKGKAYADQARYISHEILGVIDTIQSQSGTPPIIIIQGDHGPGFGLVTHSERMQNLSAYYLPGVDPTQLLYPTITPVNSFRVILDKYFGQNLPTLQDHSYYSTPENPTDLEPIPNTCLSQSH